jgi:hypothetical protein
MTTQSPLKSVDVVQGQLDAYNAQDLDAYCGFYADDIVVADYQGAVTIQGLEAYRVRYQQVFADFPQNRAELANRIVLGDRVIDHERVRRSTEAEPFEVAVIYTVANGKVVRAEFIK